MDCRYLFSHTGYACLACFCDAASGGYHPYSGVRRRWDRHKRIARWTIPIWLYVSVTGVLVYLGALQMVASGHLTPNLALRR